jgi:hypothetical protein
MMAGYRLYIDGANGREDIKELNCLNDEAAVQAAIPLFNGRPMELWRLGRQVYVFPQVRAATSDCG